MQFLHWALHVWQVIIVQVEAVELNNIEMEKK